MKNWPARQAAAVPVSTQMAVLVGLDQRLPEPRPPAAAEQVGEHFQGWRVG